MGCFDDDFDFDFDYDYRPKVFVERKPKDIMRAGEPVWVTAMGEHLTPSQMEDSHLLNARALLERRGCSRAWQDIFKAETTRRRIEVFQHIPVAELERTVPAVARAPVPALCNDWTYAQLWMAYMIVWFSAPVETPWLRALEQRTLRFLGCPTR